MKLARRPAWKVVATVLSCRDDLRDMMADSSALWQLFSMRAGVLSYNWRTCVCETFIFDEATRSANYGVRALRLILHSFEVLWCNKE
jgi:hypothetical protein